MAETGGSATLGPVTELKVTAHLMTLEPGIFCIYQAPLGPEPDRSGLPGVRLSLRPGVDAATAGVEIGGFRADGWISEFNDAALVRVSRTAQILVSIYQSAANGRAPSLQVMRIADASAGLMALGGAVPPAAVNTNAPPALDADTAEVSAHIERRGDVLGLLGEWMGEPGGKRWIEGFAIDPKDRMEADDLEYQAVLGRGWLSPWVPGGEFCGSRGMALPILGLRVRLRGAAAENYALNLSASFVDGTRIGPVSQDEAAEAESLAPLEAFRVLLTDRKAAAAPVLPASKPAAEGKPLRRVASSVNAKPVPAKAALRRGGKPTGLTKPKRR